MTVVRRMGAVAVHCSRNPTAEDKRKYYSVISVVDLWHVSAENLLRGEEEGSGILSLRISCISHLK
jgi:hypothetical protein